MRSYRYVNSHLVCTLVRELVDPLYIFYWSCWFLIRFSRQAGTPIPLVNGWLTDFVFVPVVVHFALVLGCILFNQGKPFSFPLIHILCYSLLTSIVFEGIMPHLTDYNTADWRDVVAYFAGGFFYYLVHQPWFVRRNL